jgi:hypothetical protein
VAVSKWYSQDDDVIVVVKKNDITVTKLKDNAYLYRSITGLAIIWRLFFISYCFSATYKFYFFTKIK